MVFPKNTLITIILALWILGLFAVAIWFGYQALYQNSTTLTDSSNLPTKETELDAQIPIEYVETEMIALDNADLINQATGTVAASVVTSAEELNLPIQPPAPVNEDELSPQEIATLVEAQARIAQVQPASLPASTTLPPVPATDLDTLEPDEFTLDQVPVFMEDSETILVSEDATEAAGGVVGVATMSVISGQDPGAGERAFSEEEIAQMSAFAESMSVNSPAPPSNPGIAMPDPDSVTEDGTPIFMVDSPQEQVSEEDLDSDESSPISPMSPNNFDIPAQSIPIEQDPGD